jgi:hypothetical protein
MLFNILIFQYPTFFYLLFIDILNLAKFDWLKIAGKLWIFQLVHEERFKIKLGELINIYCKLIFYFSYFLAFFFHFKFGRDSCVSLNVNKYNSYVIYDILFIYVK